MMENKEILSTDELAAACEELDDMLLAQLEKEVSEMEPHVFSKEHEENIERIIAKASKKSGVSPWRKGLQRVAVVFLVLAMLFASNQISAAVFGVNPWKIIKTQFNGTRTKTYKKAKDAEPKLTVKKVSNIPLSLPEGFREKSTRYSKNDVVATWENQKGQTINYCQFKIEDGMVDKVATGKSRKETVKVMRYEADVINEGNEIRLDWSDEAYSYFIYSDGLSKDELVEIAQSLYSKGGAAK